MAWETKSSKDDAARRAAEDKLAAALPQKATYFDAIRTNAYMNQNMFANYVEFWVAMQVDQKQDKWRVMHYMLFDMDKPDGQFKAENVSKDGDVSFPEAVYQIAKFDEATAMIQAYETVGLTPEKFPADKYPELKVHFFDVEYYRLAANIEGIAFDDAGHPYRRVEGKVFSDATFQRSEVAKSILAVETARDNPKVIAKIEGGILSDIYNSASSRNASLDNILKVGQTLACMDAFAAQVGAFYASIQSVIGKDDKFASLQGLTAEEKKDLYKKASVYLPVEGIEDATRILPEMHSQLDEAARLGIHVEPFRKFVAECELYADLLNASQNLRVLERDQLKVGGANPNLIIAIREAVDAAQKKFIGLGGSIEQVDRLKAWVANPKKDPVPPWLPGFLDRYYDSRRKVMKKVQERQAGAREVNTMPAKVKPPIVE